jgi:MOSC domain-containing protein YiiM
MISSSEATPLASISRGWAVRLIQAGKLQDLPYKDTTWPTAIYKQSLAGRVQVDRYGIVGDEHTGDGPDLDRAVCFHPLAHYRFWAAYFRRDIPIGFFGENLTLDGLADEDVCVGDIIRCGSVVFEITQPRTPCFKQARKLGVPDFVKLILQTGKPGFLARVLQPGEIEVGDAFELIQRPYPEANLVFVQRAKYANDPNMARELAQLAPLAHDWRANFAEQAQSHDLANSE